ncbi:MAG: GntR family transcriptional regulator [bacterium]
MDIQWRDDQPIYLQLRERVVGMILDGRLDEDGPLPSVRTVASEFQLNPMTVMKAYQSLVDDGIVEKRRGKGMFCIPGARQRLLEQEKQQFLDDEWPRIVDRIRSLGLTTNELLNSQINNGEDG